MLIVLIRKAYVIIAINDVVMSEEDIIVHSHIWVLYPIVIVYMDFSYFGEGSYLLEYEDKQTKATFFEYSFKERDNGETSSMYQFFMEGVKHDSKNL